MARTTLDIDDDVLRRLRERRDAEGRPMGAIASELLTLALADGAREPGELAWTTAPLGVGLDIEDKDALWSALDAPS
ncbi:hypothetical protein [Iamia sp.]|uniref:hypothetical protein n=1 Tax=Iamia sp. TaxID=2722710 RepID=UPI002C791CB7|nr:hypothetical protein [Iamia sp.]HXH55952.1 hypothetical protein [Iamia sp.]